MILLNLLIRGLITGAIYSLTSMGIVLILSTTLVMNFAQGDMGMLLAYFAFFMLARQIPYPVVFAIVILIGILLGFLFEKYLMSRARKTSHLGMVMITLALTMIFEGFVGYTFSTMPLLFPKAISGDPLQIFGVIIDKHDLFTFIVSIIIVIVLFIILYKTKIGIAARSLAEDEFGARILGIPINSIYLFIWMAAFAIAGVSGILVAGRQTLEPHFMVVIQLKGFMAAVLGGMNSIIGSVLGGFLLGMIENLVSFYIPQIKDSFSLILIVLVLLFLPQGIFGKREVRRA
ncbi:MAG TPA: branched-chain amino acid ABC transporter permease [Caldisericia bacterium]|nr:branched-chain amino acid ABC transporter permease [Caldisericia bacterium]HQN48188.1 branched-chain amino acid ABC transporter permease [Caldisericia bacterium]HQO99171.1 branched-chain amino acid ABC transporter permease [Caldisericia bacterium]